MLVWQDIILAVGSLIFAVALVPSIMSSDKPALGTSVTTGLVLTVFAFTYFSLSLWYAAVTTAITGLLWIILAVQNYE